MSTKKPTGKFGRQTSTEERTKPLLKGLERRARGRRQGSRRGSDTDRHPQEASCQEVVTPMSVNLATAHALVELAKLRGAVDGVMAATEMLGRGVDTVRLPSSDLSGEDEACVAREYAGLLEKAVDSANQFCDVATALLAGLRSNPK